ncbi:MAG: hypothetical protein B9S32_14720 [Verrucomicrobia bacterium Tous-C9LFEB]|nr:MAG: hypothetical protein B9S32_14720 [Verrucomicrobia bacterium Tous-C9LFEB]
MQFLSSLPQDGAYASLLARLVRTAMAGVLWGMAFMPGLLAAANLFNNSGFELGDTGYVAVKFQRLESNKDLLYEPARVDAATAVGGKQSLFISNRFAEQVNLFTHEVKLKRGAEYTFSIWMKGSVDDFMVHVTSLCVEADNNWQNHGAQFHVGKEWKRYNYTFKVNAGTTRDYHTFVIAWCKPGDPAADLWVDNIQLEEGALTDYKPLAVVEALSVPEKNYFSVGGLGESSSLKTIVINYGANEASAKIKTVVTDDYANDEILTKPYQVTLAPGETKVISEKLPLNRYGAFTVQTSVESGGITRLGQWSDYAVVGRIEKKLVDLSTTFVAGINWSGLGLTRGGLCVGVRDGSLIESRGMSREEFMGMLSQSGTRLLRDMDPMSVFIWKLLQPEEGKFDFSYSDKLIEIASRHGIRILPVLQGAFLVKKGEESGLGYQPKWILDKSVKRTDLPDWLRTRSLYQAPEALWKKHFQAVVEHFKGRITHYEIFNEPNLYMKVDDYVRYVDQAHDVAQMSDPTAKLVGICSTGDLGGNVESYLIDCFKAGIAKDLDVISIHPYDAPHLGSVTAADRQIQGVRSLIKNATGQEIPLWNTETYYLRGSDKNYFQTTQYDAYHASWRLLTDLGEGVQQSMGPFGDTLFKRNLAPHVDMMGWNGLVPGVNFVAYNAFARYFEGAKPVAKFKWMRDVICYVYEKDGKYRAAFWNYGESKDLKVTLKMTDEEAFLSDLFGNKISLKSQPLRLEKSPYYLVAGKLDNDAFLQALKTASVEAGKPIQVGIVRLMPEGEGWVVVVGLSNKSSKEVKGEVGVQGEGIVGQKTTAFIAEAGGEVSVKVPVTLRDFKGIESEAMVKVVVDRKLWNFPLKIAKPRVTYGAASKAGAPTSLTKVVSGPSGGRFSAAFSVSYDEQNLYLEINVQDAVSSGNPAERNPWEQDCIELFFDTDPTYLGGAHPTTYHEGVGRIFILPRVAEQGVKFQGRGVSQIVDRGIKPRIQKRTDGYDVALTIPLAALNIVTPANGKTIGFEILVDNAEGAQKALEQIGWSSDGKAHEDRLSFGFITFK